MSQEWKSQSINVRSIDLDHLNPRLSVQNQSQREIISELIKDSELLDLSIALARSANASIPPLERIIVIQNDDKTFTVIEGNRRVAAIKLLIDPSLAPDNEISKFAKASKALSDTAHSLLNPLPAIVAPNRETAAPIISEKHTNSNWVNSWSTLMQARFVEQEVRSRGDVAKVGADFNMPHSQVARFIRQAEIYAVVRSLPIDAKHSDKIDEKKFPITSLERLYNNPTFRRRFGISFNKDGHIQGSVDKNEFSRAFSRVVVDILEEKANSRHLETAEKIESYIESLGKDLPDLSKTDTFTVGNFSPAHPVRRVSSPARRRSQATSQPTGIVPRRFFAARFQKPKLQKLFDELKKLSADTVPNSAVIVFRSFLQILFSTYIKGHRGAFTSMPQRRRGEPTLGELMAYLGSNNQNFFTDPGLQKVLNTAKAQKDQLASLDSLNACTHNDTLLSNPAGARENWDYFEDIIEEIFDQMDALKKVAK